MKPKLLLHTCCAPCLIGTLFHLEKLYDITVFYFNPNVHPRAEYEKRKGEAIRYCALKGIPFIEGDYDAYSWLSSMMKVENHAALSEGGLRCDACFALRLEVAAAEAQKRGFSLFATTLSVGSNKKAETINRIGRNVAKKHSLTFIEGDFKKGGGMELSISECRRLGIYRQNYCGCVFSLPKSLLSESSDNSSAENGNGISVRVKRMKKRLKKEAVKQ
ncbi:MAG: epoxyqueuosine reductase QueH [Candidatus Woesearchaeota archaeon]|nr:epoxyqueuosine reductase QueH [Candidatus Woesearchaeota archaeon]